MSSHMSGHVCMYGLVSEWMAPFLRGCQFTKNRITLELIDINPFCLKIYDLWRLLHLFVDAWVLMDGCHITKEGIVLEPIEIINLFKDL